MASETNVKPERTVEAFLARHPEILVGREAMDAARAAMKDPDNAFTYLSKPFPNVVLVQDYDSTTNDRIFVAALVDEKRSLDHWEEHCAPDEVQCAECDRQEEEIGPEVCLFLHDPAPDHECPQPRKE